MWPLEEHGFSPQYTQFSGLEKSIFNLKILENWKKDVNKTKTIGYIAQELETVYPAAVTTVSDESGQGVVAPDDDPDNPYKFVAKERLIDVLIKATQEQQTIIEELKARITTLEG